MNGRYTGTTRSTRLKPSSGGRQLDFAFAVISSVWNIQTPVGFAGGPTKRIIWWSTDAPGNRGIYVVEPLAERVLPGVP